MLTFEENELLREHMDQVVGVNVIVFADALTGFEADLLEQGMSDKAAAGITVALFEILAKQAPINQLEG